MTYPDIEAGIRMWLSSRLPGVTVRIGLPDDVADALPLVAVERSGGSDSAVGVLDTVVLEVDVFCGLRSEAVVLADQVRAMLRTMPGAVVDGGVVARVRTLLAPTPQTWDASSVRRRSATYELIVHVTAGV